MRWFVLVLILGALVVVFVPPVQRVVVDPFVPGQDIADIRARVVPRMHSEFAEAGFEWGARVYLRVFKEERVLELWVQNGAHYGLFRTYDICNHSGDLGPKLAEGDRQSPEGFYKVTRGALNPNSSFHLSFNLGFPNAFDRSLDRTGSFLMIHGDCVSVGCYAMTDPAIEEIYLAVEAALDHGPVPVHAFPFRMTPARMTAAQGHRWFDFWRQLRPAYQTFEAERVPPRIDVSPGRYVVQSAL